MYLLRTVLKEPYFFSCFEFSYKVNLIILLLNMYRQRLKNYEYVGITYLLVLSFNCFDFILQ